MTSIAIIMTLFNRCEKTKRCIESILDNNLDKYVLDFYITNDGSSDQTEIILNNLRKKYTHNGFWVYTGNGNLFWCKGMYIAYGQALKKDYDYYIWVNNDVIFLNGFIDLLIEDYHKAREINPLSIITGVMKWQNSETVSYGGGVYKSKFRLKNVLIEPNGTIQKCQNINGNCLLIPKVVARRIGNIDDRYEHGFGDFDYGYRLLEIGGKLYVSSNFLGVCNRNSIQGTWEDKRLSRNERLVLLKSQKGLPPKSYSLFLKRWFPKFWIVHFIKPYIRILLKL